VEDMDVVLHNEMQEIPVLKEEEASATNTSDAALADSVVSRLQENKCTDRYHYDNWFDNPNSNNLFLRAMHIE
jgi:hypothetical protein